MGVRHNQQYHEDHRRMILVMLFFDSAENLLTAIFDLV